MYVASEAWLVTMCHFASDNLLTSFQRHAWVPYFDDGMFHILTVFVSYPPITQSLESGHLGGRRAVSCCVLEESDLS